MALKLYLQWIRVVVVPDKSWCLTLCSVCSCEQCVYHGAQLAYVVVDCVNWIVVARSGLRSSTCMPLRAVWDLQDHPENSLGPGRRLLPVTIQMASGASSWFRGSRWRAWLILQLRMQSDADRCYIAVIQLARRVSPAAGCRASFCWRNPPCRWTQPCQVVEFNYQFMSKVCYIFNMNWEWSSSTATDAGWDIRLDGSGESVSPNRVHPRFSCFQCWPQLEPSLEARESVDVLCCTTPGLVVWDFNYVALLVELDYQMILKAQIFKIIW